WFATEGQGKVTYAANAAIDQYATTASLATTRGQMFLEGRTIKDRHKCCEHSLADVASVLMTSSLFMVIMTACILVAISSLACGNVGSSVAPIELGGRRLKLGAAETCNLRIAPAAHVPSFPVVTETLHPSLGWTFHRSESCPNQTLSQQAQSKPGPGALLRALWWSPRSFLQGLSLFKALVLLANEARIALTPVRNAKFVVSMTTSPKRVAEIGPVIASLKRNSLQPDLIIVNLPRLFLRTGSTFGALPAFLTSDPAVLVNWCDDFGPATKILGALSLVHDPDTIIISVDDDIWYPPHHLKKLFLRSVENPGRVITGKSAMPGFIVEGFSGVLYRRGFFGDPGEVGSWIRASPKSCYLADDFVISNYLLNRHVAIDTCNTRLEGRFLRRIGLGLVPLEHGLRSDALHRGADQTSRGNQDNYAKCRVHMESDGSLYQSFPDTSTAYY
ncbi:hypothetical protein KFL_004620010, partial [Klebsormidium nitens]